MSDNYRLCRKVAVNVLICVRPDVHACLVALLMLHARHAALLALKPFGSP